MNPKSLIQALVLLRERKELKKQARWAPPDMDCLFPTQEALDQAKELIWKEAISHLKSKNKEIDHFVD